MGNPAEETYCYPNEPILAVRAFLSTVYLASYSHFFRTRPCCRRSGKTPSPLPEGPGRPARVERPVTSPLTRNLSAQSAPRQSCALAPC